MEADALGEGALLALGLGFEALAEGLRQAEGDRGHFVVGHATEKNTVLQRKQAKNRDLRKNLVVSYSRDYGAGMSDPPKRSESQTTLTISLSKILKARIEEAAAKERRKVSNWCVVELEKILDAIEGQATRKAVSYRDLKPLPPAKVAEEEGNHKTGN